MPGWGGLLAPAGTPADIVAKLNREVRRAIERPDLQAGLVAVGMEPPPSLDPAGVRSFIAKDIARWTQYVDAIGLDKLEGEAAKQ